MFPFLCPEDLVALFMHKGNESLTAVTLLHGFSDMVHQAELPALALLCCPVLSSRNLLTALLVRLQHTQSMGLTNLIAELTKLFQRTWVLPQLLSVFITDRVDNQMGVDMGSIAVSCHQHFMPRPCFFSKLLRNFMSLCRCDGFSGREGLDVLIEIHAVQFSVSCFGRFKLGDGIEAVTVDAADQMPPRLFIPYLILSHAVSHYTTHGTEVLFAFRDINHRCQANHLARCEGLHHR